MKRKVLAAILALTMVFGLAACGSKGASSDGGSSDSGSGDLIKVGIINNDPNESGYRTANDKDMKEMFTKENGYDASFAYSLKNDEQITAAQKFIQDGVDYLLLSAADTAGWDSVLKDAQDKGYAEKDPTADVEGYDACRKIAILTSLAYGKQLDFEDIYTEGITKITDRDIAYAKKMGAKVKIFGSSKKVGDKVSAMVAPQLIYPEHPLYSVDGVFNAILVKGNMVGDVMFYGQGAGKLATASAVVSDVMDAAKHAGVNIITLWDAEKLDLVAAEDARNVFFVRVSGIKAQKSDKVKKLFGNVKMVDAGYDDEFAFVTEEMSEGEYQKAAEQLEGVINKIRVDQTGLA